MEACLYALFKLINTNHHLCLIQKCWMEAFFLTFGREGQNNELKVVEDDVLSSYQLICHQHFVTCLH